MNDAANPYAAPTHGAESAAADARGWEYLGFWPRVVASFVDNIILAVLGFILGLICAFVINDEQSSELFSNIAGWILSIVFVIGFWIARNATPGKMLYSAEIRDARTFAKPTTGQYIGRYFAYIPSTLALGLGFIWVAIDKRKRGWHDMMAGTVVVRRSHRGSARPSTRVVRRAPPPRPGMRPAEDLAPGQGDR